MANKKIRDKLNDGFLQYGKKETERSERGKRIGEIFIPLGKLAFEEMTCRDEDYSFAHSMNSILSLKVRTLYPPNLRGISKNKLKVVVNEIEYDVIKVDKNKEKSYLYFLLQEVGTYEQNETENESTN
ncbi:head-tail adaptor protein [Metasolibacillus meyeri]|uniref:head-tail adaptor protein n=1 Tax=Metasolibacillus meyeri TaxID=1071052 RepID=UPI000D314AF9|nr:head-tail adaptor protein [Metasolibacillus meyeri]